jgi:hypothetical protein
VADAGFALLDFEAVGEESATRYRHQEAVESVRHGRTSLRVTIRHPR